ncbi:uncharacterized protein EAE98_007633 [Botrytis deweyae]|uniref:Uncharacterized protein n=1 Tax=Botrytis deweyae TaxID=2478750 RepID=A0ABQ7IGU5_9HELO|nr:uncharacterized protein EAE98_007633 [Botrytis deweyae]KAF7923815.1 hypothetical protein EAE98_007633 [Botrytis deweyae]
METSQLHRKFMPLSKSALYDTKSETVLLDSAPNTPIHQLQILLPPSPLRTTVPKMLATTSKISGIAGTITYQLNPLHTAEIAPAYQPQDMTSLTKSRRKVHARGRLEETMCITIESYLKRQDPPHIMHSALTFGILENKKPSIVQTNSRTVLYTGKQAYSNEEEREESGYDFNDPDQQPPDKY